MFIPPHMRGAAAMVTSMGLFMAGDTVMKFALQAGTPLFQMNAIRGVVSALLCLLLVLAMGEARNLRHVANPWAVGRGLCETVANFGFTIAMTQIPLADVTAIVQTCPLFVLLGAWLIWGERLGPVHLLLIGVGLTGAVMVAQPGAAAASPYALIGFLVAAAAAGRDILTRRVPGHLPAPVVALSVIVVIMLASALTSAAIETPVMPDSRSLLLMLLSGTVVVGGHVFVFLAYRIGPARTVAPFMYSLTIWAVLAGLLVFGDVPNALTIAGIALIILSGLAIIAMDGRRRLVTA